MSIGVVIKAKNEEKNIGIVLKYVFRQSLKPDIVVVVNDGSRDRTGEIARKMGATVIDLPDRGIDAVSLPHIASVINAGLKRVREEEVEFVCLLDVDHVLPKFYFEKIVKRMKIKEEIVVASGVIKGEKTSIFTPRDSGRIVNYNWWMKHGGLYPVYYGSETWLIYRALRDGLKVAVFRDVVSFVLRPTRHNPFKYYRYALEMKALGYWFPYVLGRAIVASKRHPLNGFMILKGYMMPIKRYEELGNVVEEFNKYLLKRSVRKLLG